MGNEGGISNALGLGSDEELFGRDCVNPYLTLVHLTGDTTLKQTILVLLNLDVLIVLLGQQEINLFHIEVLKGLFDLFVAAFPVDLGNTNTSQKAVLDDIREDVEAIVLTEDHVVTVICSYLGSLYVLFSLWGELDNLVTRSKGLQQDSLK